MAETSERENLWARLRRRKVVQWGIGYVAVAWGLLQGIGFVADAFHWPDATKQVATLVLLIGLPIVLVLAWYHRDHRDDTETAGSGTAVPTAASAASSGAVSAINEKSIAVLPFADMSADKDQEYMSDGIAEELLNLLTKVTELKVIARTSSFAFKGGTFEIAEIAKRLNVAHVLEGSVRKSGNKLRITAQLVRASDSMHLWSQMYERSLDDIFAVQDEIAAQVVKALRVTLLGGEPATPSGKHDVEAYSLLLQGRFFAQRRTQEDSERALRCLESSLQREPAYAPTWVELANVHVMRSDDGWVPTVDGYQRAREAVEKALSLDPSLAAAHSAMQWVQVGLDRDWVAAKVSNRKALELEPGNAEVLLRTGWLAAELGHSEEALVLLEKSIEHDPLQLYGPEYRAILLLALGRYTEAEVSYRRVLELSPTRGGAHASAGVSLLLRGQTEEALREMEREPDERWRLCGLSLVYHTLNRAADSDAMLRSLETAYAREVPMRIAEVHAWRGADDLAFEWLDRAYEERDAYVYDIKLNVFFARLADDPRFKAFLRKMKLPEEPPARSQDAPSEPAGT